MCNILGLEKDPFEHKHIVKPMTHVHDNAWVVFSFVLQQVSLIRLLLKLQPAIFPLSQHVIHFHELPADTTQRFLQQDGSHYA